MIIRGARPYGEGEPVDVVVRDRVIADIGATGTVDVSGEEVLDAEGREVAKAAAAYVLTCIRSWDPDFSLEPVVRGPVASREAAAAESVEEVAKEVASRFHSSGPAS